MHTNQSIPYSSTGVSGSVTGRGEGPDRHSILYECLIPNRNVKDGVRSDSSLVGGASVTDVSSLVTRRHFVRVFLVLCVCVVGLFHRRYK